MKLLTTPFSAALLALILPFFAGAAAAQSLYEAPPTPTSAFVRFIGSDVSPDMSWMGQDIVFGDYSEGDYIAIESADIDTQARNFLTIVASKDGQPIVFDEVDRETGKIPLQLLNLTDQPVSLKTSDGKITILKAVDPESLKARQINPLAFSVKIVSVDGALATLDLNIKRNANPLIVVRNDGSVALFESPLSGATVQ